MFLDIPQTVSGAPWWAILATIISTGFGVFMGAMNWLQSRKNVSAQIWQQNYEAIKAERDLLESTRAKLETEVKRQAVIVAELRAKTDLDAVRETQLQILKAVNGVVENINSLGATFLEAFTKHSADDNRLSTQLINTLQSIQSQNEQSSGRLPPEFWRKEFRSAVRDEVDDKFLKTRDTKPN